ncbi:unnamed protein product [Miscanthus lutarioriparius]|uniref:Uncharacterized protein n=1 Tax=Miscanthus lutarioriparius TaxID=422564 RepID=A0A811MSI8_9POAL|nr:unnamed protein product [Miscanthus lutarioriparius]
MDMPRVTVRHAPKFMLPPELLRGKEKVVAKDEDDFEDDSESDLQCDIDLEDDSEDEVEPEQGYEESFNNWIKDLKAMNLDDFMDKLRQLLMVKWNQRRKIGKKLDGLILPHIIKMLNEKSRELTLEVSECSEDVAEVTTFGAHLDRLPFQLRKWRISVGDIVISVYPIKSIVQRTGSSRAFMDISIRIKVVSQNNTIAPEAVVPFTLEIEVVSLFVLDNLDLVVGDKSQLIAAKGLTSDNMLKLVARVLKQNRGGHYLSMCKFAYDSNNDIVYVKVTGEEDANLMVGRSFKVAGERMSFYRVLSISVRPVEEDSYQSAICHRIFPFNFS